MKVAIIPARDDSKIDGGLAKPIYRFLLV